MKKSSLLFMLLACGVMLITDYQTESQVIRIISNAQAYEENNQTEESANQEEDVINEIEEQEQQIPGDDELYISITAEVHVDEDRILVEGQSNLPEGAVLNSSAVANR